MSALGRAAASVTVRSAADGGTTSSCLHVGQRVARPANSGLTLNFLPQLEQQKSIMSRHFFPMQYKRPVVRRNSWPCEIAREVQHFSASAFCSTTSNVPPAFSTCVTPSSSVR